MLSLLLGLTLGAGAPSNPMIDLITRFATDLRDVRRFHSLDATPAAESRLASFIADWRSKLGEVDVADLDLDGRIDHTLLVNQLSKIEAERALKTRRFAQTADLLPFREAILELEHQRRNLVPLDPRESAAALAGIEAKAKETKKSLEAEEKDGHDMVVAKRAADEIGGLKQTLETWFKHYDGYKPVFGWWTKTPYQKADAALGDLQKHLREKVLGFREGEDEPLIGSPIGREALLADIRHELLDESPEELIAMAAREFEWCRKEYLRAAREMGFGDDWRAALEKVKQNHVPPGEQDELVAGLAREAIAFVKERDLLTIEPLCEETWRVDMISERDQKTWPFQFYGGQRIAVGYPLETMDHEAKMMSLRGNNRHFTRCTVQHELIPGHHLQLYMAARYKPYRDLFQTPFFVEGWCLHWEMLLYDLEFPKTPEDRIGYLFWRSHRCARIVVSLKFHLGEMTPEEMIQYLVDEVGHERFTATSEVRRYIGEMYSPLYQCAYLIGGLQLRDLYKKHVGSGRMTPKAFHDAVLRQGSIPMKLLAMALEG